MPQPPDVGLITKYIFENPYPFGIGLLMIGVVLGWFGLRDGRTDRLRQAAISILIASAVLVTGFLVLTPGERGRGLVKELVDNVIAEDLVASSNLLTNDARIHLGSEKNVGRDLDFIIAGLSRLAGQFQIENNRITMLRGYRESSDAATVHLGCWTEAGYGYTPSQWVVRVHRQENGSWKISHITCISINGEAPPSLPW